MSPTDLIGAGVAVAEELFATVFGGLIVATLVYVLIQRRQERRRRAEINRDILEALRQELEHNRHVAEAMREHLPAGALPFESFELAGWTLVSQIAGFTNLEPKTVDRLLNAYRRLRGANDQHALLLDLMYGPTGTLSLFLAGAATSNPTQDGLQLLEKRRADLRRRLQQRVEDLEPHLESALDRIRQDLESR